MYDIDPNISYPDAKEGLGLSIRSGDDAQHCRITQGDNEIVLDRALLACIRQFMDEGETVSGALS